MPYSRPLALTLLGSLNLAFALMWLAWLGLTQGATAHDLFGAGLGDPLAIHELSRRHLARPGSIYVTLLTLMLELLLTLILLVSGIGLLARRPWARWSVLFYCAWVILVEVGSTLARAFYLTPATERVAVLPLLVNCGTILFAIVLWGLILLPSVESAWAEPGANHNP